MKLLMFYLARMIAGKYLPAVFSVYGRFLRVRCGAEKAYSEVRQAQMYALGQARMFGDVRCASADAPIADEAARLVELSVGP